MKMYQKKTKVRHFNNKIETELLIQTCVTTTIINSMWRPPMNQLKTIL